MKSYVGNPNSLADCILFVLFNPEKAKLMRERALKKVIACYNWDIIADETINLYNDVLGEAEDVDWKIIDVK